MNRAEADVLIIGAGPTGLMMACQLARWGVRFIIIDKNAGPSEKSKALTVQARTLEIYDQMGIADKAVEEGHRTEALQFVVKGKKVQRVPLTDAGTGLSPFPFLHIFEQNKNEKLLIGYLSERDIRISWNTELVSFRQDAEAVIAVIRSGGEQEEIICRWCVGADGGKSVVRHQLNAKFEGGTYENIFYVADTRVDWKLGYNELFLYFSRKTFTGFFPMKGTQRFRLVGVLPKQFQNEEEVVFEDISGTLKKNFEIPIDFSETKWFSVYRLHHRCVSEFRHGRIFLAGDAAHIHSPAGGQGMNTGLQDAYNLAWKMALVIKKISSEKILDSYKYERHPLARRLVRTTDLAFAIAVSPNFFIILFRVYILPWFVKFFMGFRALRTFAFITVSQIGINYRKSISSKNRFIGKKARVKAGDRLPFVAVSSGTGSEAGSIYDLLRQPSFHVIIFGKPDSEKWSSLRNSLESEFPGLFDFIVVPDIPDNENAFRIFGAGKLLLCLVRPDNYIGYLSDEINPPLIREYLNENIAIIYPDKKVTLDL